MKQFKFASTLLSIIFGAVMGFAHSVEVTQAFEPFDEFTPAEEPKEFIAEPWSVNYVPSWGSTSSLLNYGLLEILLILMKLQEQELITVSSFRPA